MSDKKSMKWKLMTIRGMDEPLADQIVASGLTMLDLSQFWEPICLVFEANEAIAKIIKAAAARFARVDGEVKSTEEIAKIRESRPKTEYLIGAGLSQNQADVLFAAYDTWWVLAMENVQELVDIFDFSPAGAIIAVVLARMICHWDTNSSELMSQIQG